MENMAVVATAKRKVHKSVTVVSAKPPIDSIQRYAELFQALDDIRRRLQREEVYGEKLTPGNE